MRNLGYKGILVVVSLFVFFGISMAQQAQYQHDPVGFEEGIDGTVNITGGTGYVPTTTPNTNTNTKAKDYEGDTGLIKCTGVNCDFDAFFATVTKILKYLYVTAFSVATLLFAYAGVLLMSSQGDVGKVEKAKSIFKNVIIGFVIMFLSYWIVWTLLKGLGVDKSFYDFLTG